MKLEQCLDLNNPVHVKFKEQVEKLNLPEEQAIAEAMSLFRKQYNMNVAPLSVPASVSTQNAPQQAQPDIEAKKADIERRRQEELNQQTDAGYSIIALDYLFTGGRDVMLSTDYLLQALVGGFTHSAKEINDIRNKYANKLGNIRDDINSDVYNQMMGEIRNVISKTYNDSKANEIFDKILKNATGFTNREGNQISIELDKLNEQNESKINAKYDAEYIDKVKKGEFTKQQAKDALKEINRLTPELEKQIDNAESATLEETSGVSGSALKDVEDKKADIEIGKVGNTEYEVKVDGVYYQGKKLNNPENKTHRQLIEAEIERRRQELGLQTVKGLFEPSQGSNYFRIILKGDKFDVLAFFDGGQWSIFPKQPNGEFQASDPKTGNALILNPKQRKEVVEKYAPKELIDLLEAVDRVKGIAEQDKFMEGRIKTYLDLYEEEILRYNLDQAEQSLAIYESPNYPNKDSQDRIVKAQKKEIAEIKSKLAKYDAELAELEKQQEKSLEQQLKDGDITQFQYDFAKKIAEKQPIQTVGDKQKEIEAKSQDDVEKALKILRQEDEELEQAKTSTDEESLISQEEINFIIKTFGKETLQHLYNVINSNAYGTWKNAIITLFADARQGTGYHEAWHHFSQMYLTKEQKLKLYEEAVKINPELKTLRQKEEFLADSFKDFMLTGKTPFKQNRSLLQKILDFIKWVFTNQPTVDRAFNQLRKGKLNHYTPSINNALFGTLNASIKNSKGLTILDAIDSPKYVAHFHYILGKAFRENNISISILESKDKKTYDSLSTLVYNAIQKDLLINPDITLSEIMLNKDDFKSVLDYSLEKLKYIPKQEIDVDPSESFETQSEDEFKISDEAGQEEKKEVNNADKGYENRQESMFEFSSPSIRKMFQLLPKGRIKYNQDGTREVIEDKEGSLGKTADTIRTYSLIAQKLEGSIDTEDMLERLSDEDFYFTLPEAKFVYDILNNSYKQNMSQADKDFVLQFWNTFNKIYVPIYSGFQDKEGNFYMKEQTRDVLDKIKKSWFTNLLSKGGIQKNMSIPESNNGLFTEQQVITLLDDLGIKLSEDTIKSPEFKELINNSYDVPDEKFAGYINYFITSLKERLQKGQNITNVYRDFSKEFQGIKPEMSFLNKVVEIESKYTKQFSTMMVKTTEGNTKYGMQLPSLFSRIGSFLRSNTLLQIDTKKQYEPFRFLKTIDNSLILNSLYDKLGNRIKVSRKNNAFIFGDYNGAKFMELGEKEVPKQTTDMTPKQKFVFDLHSLLTKGIIDIPRTESSGTSYFIKIEWYNLPTAKSPIKRKDIPFSLDFLLDENEEISSAAYDSLSRIFTGYLKDELKSGGISVLKDIINDTNLEEQITKDYEEGKNIDTYRNTIGAKLRTFFEQETQELETIAKQLGVDSSLSPQLTKEIELVNSSKKITPSLNGLLKTFLINDFIIKTEYAKLFEGPLHQVKTYHKRAKIAISTGTEMNTSDILQHLQDQRHLKNGTMRALMGIKEGYSVMKFKTRMLKEDEVNLKQIELEKLKKAFQSIAELNKWTPEQTKAKKEQIVKQWSQTIKVGDGGGYITMDGYRQVLEQSGSWQGKELSAWYNAELLLFKKEILGQPLTEIEEQKMQENLKLAKNIPVLKLQHAGHLANQEQRTAVAHKFAVTPLFPSLVLKNPVLKELMMDMVKNGEIYTYFESATKKATPEQKKLAFNMFGTDRSTYSFEKYDTAPEVFAIFTKEQIKPSFELKESTTWGTQMRKLFLANMFNEGQTTERIKKLYNEYLQVLDKFSEIERFNLLKQLGAELKDEQIVVKDRKSFIESLIHEAKNQGLSTNVQESLQYDPIKKDFKYNLDFNPNTSAIQDLISGIVFKRVVRAKTNGDMLVMEKSTGYAKEPKFYEMEYDDNNKPIRVKAAECKVGLTEKHQPLLNLNHYDGKKIETIERLNEAIDNEEWRKQHYKHLTIISYRIPTQGINSMEFFTIHEFLPPVFGNTIVVPKEIVLKAGSDFDIDKLPSMFPSFDEFGNLLDDNWATKSEIEKKILELEKQIKLLTKSNDLVNAILGSEEDLDLNSLNQEVSRLAKELKKNVKFQKDYYTNKAIDIYYEILSSPEMFDQLMTPNNVEEIKPVAKEMVKLLNLDGYDKKGEPKNDVNTSILKFRTNLTKFVQFISGKKDLGVFALSNTFSQLLQIANVSVNKNYEVERIVGKGKQRLKRTATQPFISPEKRNLSLASKTDVEGTNKQEIFSQLINSTVDIANDPYYSAFGINNYNKGVVVNMLMQNVPFRTVILFINQPILREYYSSLNKEYYFKPTEKSKPFPRTNKAASELVGIKKSKDLIPAIENFDFREEDYVSPQQLEENINNNVFDKRMMFHYLKQKEQADLLRNAQQSLSFDTKKFFTPIGAELNIENLEKIESLNFFNNLDKINKESLISAFDSRKILSDIYKDLFPTAYEKDLVSLAKSLLKEANIFSRADQYQFERTLSNDFIDYLVKQYGIIRTEGNPVNFGEYTKTIIYKGSNNLAQRLATLKTNKDYQPLFEKYRLLSYLKSMDSEKNPNILNIELNTGLENPVEQQELFTEEFENLLNFGEENYSSQQREEIRKFARDLAYVAIGQSGFNKSYLYFTNIVPSNFIQPILQEALNTYQEQPNHLKDIQDFLAAFRIENPKFNLSLSTKSESFRGKYLYDKGTNIQQQVYLEEQSSMTPIDQYEEVSEFVSQPFVEQNETETIKNQEQYSEFSKLPTKSSNPTMTYAGIGSRETPQEILGKMTEVAKYLEEKGYTLRSGAAQGADTAFEKGVKEKKEIFPGSQKAGMREQKIAREIHPNPNALDKSKNPEFVWNLMARNTNQIFGKNLDTPVDFVIAWTKDGLTDYRNRTVNSGGTGQAIEMASRKGIPVINMFNPSWREQLLSVLNKNKPVETKQNVEVVTKYSDTDLKNNLNKIYIFGDNMQRVGTGGQAQIRNNPNAFGIVTKIKPTMNSDAFMSDKDLEKNKQIIDSDILKIKAQNKTVVFPKNGLGTGLAKLKEKAPQTYEYLKQKLLQEFGFNNDTGNIVGKQQLIEETNRKVSETINVTNNSYEEKLLNNALDKAIKEYLPEQYAYYLDLPLGLTNKQQEEISFLLFEDGKSKLAKQAEKNYVKRILTKEDLEKAKIAEKNYNWTVYNEDGDISVKDIIKEIENKATTLIKDSQELEGLGFKDLIETFKRDKFDEFTEVAEAKLREYGLFPLINYNPNQLTLFDLDINQELNNNESQC